MLETHMVTKEKFNVEYVVNYEKLSDDQVSKDDLDLLSKCNIFIYQPFNKPHDYSEYDVTNILSKLPENCLVLRINYYRFKGFWYNNTYRPYSSYRGYTFNENVTTHGIHDSFEDYHSNDVDDIKLKIDNIDISKSEINNYFNEMLTEFRYIDDNSDVNMYKFLLEHYKTKHLFHDPFHPTLIFFYEVFRQLVFKLLNIKLKDEDEEFLSLLGHIDLHHWAVPVLPIIKKHLELDLPEKIYAFHEGAGHPHTFKLSVYDYYFISLSKKNFDIFLLESELKG